MARLGIGTITQGFRRAGQGMAKAGSNRAVLAGLGVTAFGVGMASSIAPAARDAAFDFALGDPNADVAFTGRKLDTRYLIGKGMPGPIGYAMRASSPDEYTAFDTPVPTKDQVTAGIGVGAAIGTGVGFIAGRALGLGNKGSSLLAGLGTMTGSALGASTAFVATNSLRKQNERFFKESPYSPISSVKKGPSRTTAQTMYDTNAVGDIVLGMHNSRRGY